MKKTSTLLLIGCVLIFLQLTSCKDESDEGSSTPTTEQPAAPTHTGFPSGPSGKIQDEAMFVGRDAASLPGSDSDYLRDMDGGLNADQVHSSMSAMGATEAVSPKK